MPNRTCISSDVIAFIVSWCLLHRLPLCDLCEMSPVMGANSAGAGLQSRSDGKRVDAMLSQAMTTWLVTLIGKHRPKDVSFGRCFRAEGYVNF